MEITVCPECGRETWRREGLTYICKQGHQHPAHVADLGGEIKKTYKIGGVSGATLPVSDGGKSLTVDGPLTDDQLRTAPVPVDVTDGSGSLTVDGPLTDAQLRAAPVRVEHATHPPRRIWHYAAEHTEQETDVLVRDAPGPGFSLYITDIYLECDGPVVVSLEEARRQDERFDTALKFRHRAKDQGDWVDKTFVTPTKLAENSGLTLTTSTKATVVLLVNGYIGTGDA
jgi:hypothetical protein